MLTNKPFGLAILAAFSTILLVASTRAEDSWPDLSKPARSIGGGEHDAAVVVGVENYFAVPGVLGAKSNASEWYDYLTATRGIPPQNVKLLTNADATREEILGSASKAAAQAGAKGTLWFVFIGHGAPSTDGKDGLLIGVDAQQKSESLQNRSVRRGELLTTLASSPAGSIRVILDACFSGRGPSGASIAPGLQPLVTVTAAGALDPRMAVLTAAKGDQFAGSLPGANLPAFSYLVLGGLRGWAAGPDGKVTAGSLLAYTKNALAATLRGRDQTPDLMGSEGAAMGSSAGEKGPNLGGLAKATAGGAASAFQVSALPSVSAPEMPTNLDQEFSRLNLGGADVDVLEKYDAVAKFEEGAAGAAEKALKWRALAKDTPIFAVIAEKRAALWEAYAARKEAADMARDKRLAARDADWSQLGRLLAVGVVGQKDKRDWAGQFLKAYFKSPGVTTGMANALAPYAADDGTRAALRKLARTASEEAGIRWINIPGGRFTMSSDDAGSTAQPRHEVTIETFDMARTLVTNKQYKACVAAAACTPADFPTSSWKGDSEPSAFNSDDQPVVHVTWRQAAAFSEWVGGRLPSEAEWEYAARSGGKNVKYPWGNEAATCSLAVIAGCGRATAQVCSKPEGNTQQGLCDMAGNAYHWVQDWYHDSYKGAPADGSPWEIPAGSERVIRGGSWRDNAEKARAASRDYIPSSCDSLGFRPVRVPAHRGKRKSSRPT